MTLLTIGIIGVIFLIVVSGLYVFVIGFVRKADIPWLVESEIRKTPFGKYYRQITDANQWLFDHNAQGLNIESHDGLKLHGLWVPAEDARGTILLVHGYRSTYLVDFAPAFAHYHQMGLNLLIPSQRAHGESEGKLITFGVKESQDMLLWCKYHNRHLTDCDIVLSGLSMGASTVIYMTGETLPENVKGIIADCGFTSPKDILRTVFKKVTHLPGEPALFVTNLITKLFAGFSINDCDSRKILRKISIPVLLIHGKCDTFVPCEMTKQAYEACNSIKEILLVDGAEHGESFLVDPESYILKVKNFIANILGIALGKE